MAWSLPGTRRNVVPGPMTDPAVAPLRWPRGARLVDARLFRVLLEMEIQKAQRLRYSLAIVSFRGEIPAASSGEASLSLAGVVAGRVRATDVALERGPQAVILLLLDADVAALPVVLRRLTLDFEVTPWSAGASSYPKSGASAEELLSQAERMLAEAGRAGGRRLLVQS